MCSCLRQSVITTVPTNSLQSAADGNKRQGWRHGSQPQDIYSNDAHSKKLRMMMPNDELGLHTAMMMTTAPTGTITTTMTMNKTDNMRIEDSCREKQ